VVEAIAPTFGGINLEDIAAPHCFEIEAALKRSSTSRSSTTTSHGTAVIICAGLINALRVQDKSLETAKIVCLGAGAAGIASLNLLVAMGAQKRNILLVDSKGVVHKARTDLNSFKKAYARQTKLRTLEEAMTGADVSSACRRQPGEPAMVKSMADKPVVFALANPNPEILPEKAKAARSDLIMATGRSDYPNQVNNVLGFPFIFRGALDARAKQITEAMLIAAVHALAELAREPVPASVLKAYKLKKLAFGPEYILPSRSIRVWQSGCRRPLRRRPNAANRTRAANKRPVADRPFCWVTRSYFCARIQAMTFFRSLSLIFAFGGIGTVPRFRCRPSHLGSQHRRRIFLAPVFVGHVLEGGADHFFGYRMAAEASILLGQGFAGLHG